MIPDEGQNVERKESLGEWREIIETCAAFSTAQGGRIFVGVADDGRVVGVQVGKGTLEDLANKIAQNTAPKVVPGIATAVEGRKTVVVVDVREHPAKPVCAFGRAYRRSGRTNQVLSAPEVADLYFASRGVTWDETVRENATLDDVDPEKVRRFLTRARSERQWEVNPKTPLPKALAKLKLARDEQPTVAALLLFGRDPQQFLSQAKVRCARFKGDTEVEFLDMKVMEGDLVEQVESAMAFVRRNTSMAAKIEGKIERTERWEYPLDAIREAVTNAICHRDYASTGSVQLRIFDDRLEVSNPGELPEGLTVEDLRQAHESRPRNKLVADAFFLIKYIEQFGTGTGRMIRLCHDADVPEPEFESRSGAFRIVFRRERGRGRRARTMELNERQLRVLNLVAERGRVTPGVLEKALHIPKRTMQRDLQLLSERSLLRRHGGGKNTWYSTV